MPDHPAELQPCASDLRIPREGASRQPRAGASRQPRAGASRQPREGALHQPLGALDDPEGARLDPSLPPVIDAHVHLFPDRVFDAVWRWFDRHGWPIRYRLHSEQVIRFLLDRGVRHLVALHYSHTPGMARALNHYMAELCADHPQVTGLATVLPGEPGAEAILREAFDLGLRGVKLHCHVQCFSPDDEPMAPLYALCAERGLPMVIHAGREPKSPAYRCDPHALCSADRVRRVLDAHPTLKLCIPHLGADEFEAYADLLQRYDTLWLDTTMMLADYFPMTPPPRIFQVRPDRLLYGSDFPNLPYAWDRELARIRRLGLSDEALRALLAENAAALFDLPLDGAGPAAI